jgi:hypothetical protein
VHSNWVEIKELGAPFRAEVSLLWKDFLAAAIPYTDIDCPGEM